ncbi:L-aspartate oxidase [Prolixibacteraceae bacterium Z1-6]|uniref:L-aspartate oxidase n=1 Tax=Draconibacterium aestuarii TaxID=2998507 RepID=A0A9X3F642_9BACT|nr:L-aspartate oxidase [Prolixibacteraceae bacterium Z1-6]
MQVLEFDTVVIGSGLAGLSAAYHSSKFGSVAIVTKSQLDTSNSYYAQGGIAAAIADNDSPEQHAHDTLVTGRGLCDHDAVDVLVKEGKERVLELVKMGMPFDKEGDNFILGLEGGHTKRRILHAGGDATGKELTCFKLDLIRKEKNVQAFEFVAAIKLLHKDNCMLGVQAYDFKTNKNIVFKTKAVILATGGLSRIFSRSTNPHTATGDGIAMAYEAGAKLADLEFIQFHPSALYVPKKEAYLISEAVRGEGAWLLNQKGDRFMKDIHPLAELAPRDVVAYSIFRQIQKSDKKHIYLSLKHLDKEKIKNRFKNIDKHLQEYGFNLTEDLLPISPAAHYMVGGVRTNLDAETNISGLFVCGEVASTGVMGANRLASNSLLECLVFGKRASEKAAKLKDPHFTLEEPEPIILDADNEELFLNYQNELATLMSENLGIVRNKKSLEYALARFNEILKQFSKEENKYNLIKIKNAVNICKLIATAALIREESRGGHIREDFQKENPDFKTHIIQQKDKKIHFEPIRN